jgi:hypothetical protein
MSYIITIGDFQFNRTAVVGSVSQCQLCGGHDRSPGASPGNTLDQGRVLPPQGSSGGRRRQLKKAQIEGGSVIRHHQPFGLQRGLDLLIDPN